MRALKWTTVAADELEAAQRYYHDLNPAAARTLAQRLLGAAQLVQQQPHVGRSGMREGTREWVVSHTPYVLVYRVRAADVEIVHVWHAARAAE